MVSSTLSGLLDYGVSFVVLLGLMQYFDIQLGWKILLWPLLTIVLVMLSLGIGMILSSLNVKYRDIGHTIPFMMQLWLFVSPIIYPISMIPERYRGLASLNPIVWDHKRLSICDPTVSPGELAGIVDFFGNCLVTTGDWVDLL